MDDTTKRPLSVEEIERLISVIDLSTAVGIRNATMILIMVFTGAKVGELVGKEGGGAVVRGGIRINDYDPIPMRIQQYLLIWLDARPSVPESDLLFVTGRGTRIQNRYVRRMISEYGRAAGIDRDVRPSLLRRTYAQGVLRESGDLHVLKEALGHRHLASSIRYLDDQEGAG